MKMARKLVRVVHKYKVIQVVLAKRHRLYMKICRKCGASNAPTATECRKCRSENLSGCRLAPLGEI